MRSEVLRAPGFVRGRPLLEDSFELAREAHHGPRRRGKTNIDHPVAVAQMLDQEGFSEEVVAAALLHDVVEDTATDLPELAERFGPEVCELVAEMTEDQSIPDYGDRKAEHRSRIKRRSAVAAIYCADKLANARAMESPEQTTSERLDHYITTLRLLCETHPELPFLGDLRTELERLQGGAEGSRGNS